MIRSASQGTFHRLYEVREPARYPRLLRVAALEGDSSARVMELEAALMASLRTRGFPIPGCEYRGVSRQGHARGVHLMENARAESLTAIDADEPRMLAALGEVGRFLQRLHGVRGTGFGPIVRVEGADLRGAHPHWDAFVLMRLDEHVASCEGIGAIARHEAADIVARFEGARPSLRAQQPALLHGDPGSHNFLVDESGIRAVIDWEDALLGDPLFDLASLCTFHPERRHSAIWSGYGIVLAPGNDAWERFWLYFLRIALAKTVHRHRFGYPDRPDRPPASRRIQLALERLGEAG